MAASSFALAHGLYRTVLKRDQALDQCETDGRGIGGLVAGDARHVFRQRVQGPTHLETETEACGADVATPIATQKKAEAVAYAAAKLEGKRWLQMPLRREVKAQPVA